MPYPFIYDIYLSPLHKVKGPVALYGVFKIENGKYLGYVENSFYMSWEPNMVRVCDLGIAKHFMKNNKDKPAFILRLTRDFSPIICDFETRHKLWREGKLQNKQGRNVSFIRNPSWVTI